MGGSLCARRSTTGETKQSQPAPFKDMKHVEAKCTKKADSKVATETAAMASLPTKSWSALLKEAPLNPDAKPFKPADLNKGESSELIGQPSPKAPPGLDPPGLNPMAVEPQGKNNIYLINADKDDPEGMMKYLSKKLQQPGGKPTPVEPPWLQRGNKVSGNQLERNNRPISDRLRSNSGYSSIGAGDSGAPKATETTPASGIVMNTQEYLKILKDGKPKSHGAKSMTNGSGAGKGKLGKGKSPLMNIHRLLGENDSNSQGFGADLAMPPMTASGLAKKWASTIKGDSAENATEEDAPRSTIQDDVWIEKALVDQDLSDPAYYSETECVPCKGPSAHLLGRRPGFAKHMIRSYVMQDLSFELDRAVGMLLLRLQRFTDHHRAFKQEGNLNRRFVIGLKEVARRTKQAKVDCLIVAPDIEEDADSGGLDDRMRELLASAYQRNIPVVFALSRTRLGRVLGKSLQISVLGVLDSTGARELMAQSIQLAHDCRQAWLSRIPA